VFAPAKHKPCCSRILGIQSATVAMYSISASSLPITATNCWGFMLNNFRATLGSTFFVSFRLFNTRNFGHARTKESIFTSLGFLWLRREPHLGQIPYFVIHYPFLIPLALWLLNLFQLGPNQGTDSRGDKMCNAQRLGKTASLSKSIQQFLGHQPMKFQLAPCKSAYHGNRLSWISSCLEKSFSNALHF